MYGMSCLSMWLRTFTRRNRSTRVSNRVSRIIRLLVPFFPTTPPLTLLLICPPNIPPSVYPNPDGSNTVERVRLSSLPAGSELEIRVSAVFLPSLGLEPNTPQRWAVAVVGHFEGLLRSELNPAWLRLGSIPPSPQPPSPPAPPRAKAPRAPLKKKSPPPPVSRPRKPPPRPKPPPRMKLPPRSPN
ncbi:hypothetical protein Vafri_11768 [Volvox africanus]|uniref:Uncharacterized protein n=1 Tax=Volvox africanus TaxID=51714 RepID=A0A8J4F0Z0_9CHLO|nr:hypothetical protein Vafri_11768 [Volvox africanus]